jgi:hypothetical protein
MPPGQPHGCLDIEIIHRRSLGGDAEQISINLQARGIVGSLRQGPSK